MKLTKAQGIQTLKTIGVLAFSADFRDTVVKSVVDNTRGTMEGYIAKYKHLAKNQSTVALIRMGVDSLFDSYELANAYELEDISSQPARTLIETVIATYQKELGWTQEEFDNLVDTDFSRLKITEKIQLMMATPREGSAYYEGEAVVKEVLKPFTNSYASLRDSIIEIYSDNATEFFSSENPDYQHVGKGKYVHNDLLKQYEYTQSAEYYLTTTHGLTVENSEHFIDKNKDVYHIPHDALMIIKLMDDKFEMNQQIADWIEENNYQFDASVDY